MTHHTLFLSSFQSMRYRKYKRLLDRVFSNLSHIIQSPKMYRFVCILSTLSIHFSTNHSWTTRDKSEKTGHLRERTLYNNAFHYTDFVRFSLIFLYFHLSFQTPSSANLDFSQICHRICHTFDIDSDMNFRSLKSFFAPKDFLIPRSITESVKKM
jgi:hypothetical protein